MVDRDDVAAVIVTRGNVDLEPSLATIPFPTIIWNNAERDHDLSVYGRYAAVDQCDHPLIYVQDDDCIVDPSSIAVLLAAHRPGHVVCNMPEPFRTHYSDSALVGFGAIFDRDLPRRAFERYVDGHQRTVMIASPTFPAVALTSEERREADTIFTALTPMLWVDVPYENLPHAYASDRLYRQAEHVGARQRVLRLAREVRDAR